MIYIVGCNHGIQRVNPRPLDASIALEQRGHFKNLIEGIIEGNKVQCIAEEWGLCEMTIAHTLAHARQIPWCNINTSPESLRELRIPIDYPNKEKYGTVQVRAWHALREQFMVQELGRERGAAQNVLVICGFEHMEPIFDSLSNVEPPIEKVDYRNSVWYRSDVFCDDP